MNKEDNDYSVSNVKLEDKKKIISQIIIIVMAIFGICTCCFPYLKVTSTSTNANYRSGFFVNGFSILTVSDNSFKDLSVFIKLYTIIYVTVSFSILVVHLIKFFLGNFNFSSKGIISCFTFVFLSTLYFIFGVQVRNQFGNFSNMDNFYTGAFWPLIINAILTIAFVLLNSNSRIKEKKFI